MSEGNSDTGGVVRTIRGLSVIDGAGVRLHRLIGSPRLNQVDPFVLLDEFKSDNPKAVLGLFDPSARVCVKPDLLTFSIPWPKFISMLENMDKCFLTTALWETVTKRMKKGQED